jgi:predicted O-methyltransferase YrrM
MSQGQITEGSERCKIIKKTITTYNPKTILEIGTWKGMGSTKCILDSIDDSVEFISLESNMEFFNIARNNLSSYSSKFKQIYGRIIEIDEVLEFSKEVDLTPQQKGWLDEDIKNFNKCENVFDNLPEVFDLIFLDGGEFSTYPEWTKLKSRSKIILLDDINVLKCNKIYNELIDDPNYELLDKTNEGHGFCCFYKKD